MSGSVATLRARARPTLSALLERGKPGLLETVVAFVLLTAFGVALYAPHVLHGGFLYDDWANYARSHYSGSGSFGDALDYYADFTPYRPFLIVYVPLTHFVLGLHYGWHIAWAVALAVGMSTGTYLLLRSVGFERVHAFLIGALVMAFPASDAIRLWPTGSMATLAVAFLLFGAVAALYALDARRPWNWMLHVTSVVLYLLSVLTYELGAPLILLMGLLYLTRGDRREALVKWGVDVVAVVIVLVTITAGHQDQQSLGGMWDHFTQIVDQGMDVVAAGAVPYGTPPTAAVIVLAAAVCIVAFVVLRLSSVASQARPDLRRWLVVAGAGLLVSAAGWVLLVPADPYYSPMTLGVGNRVNAVASIGVVMMVYAVVMLAATMAFRELPRSATLASVLGVVAVLGIGWGYVRETRHDIDVWDAAFAQQQQVANFLGINLPQPEARSVIYLYGQPAYYAPGVPVFASSWDLNGWAQAYYGDGTLQAFPQSEPLRCGRNGVTSADPASSSAPYGRAILADYASGRVVRVTSRRQCNSIVSSFQPGPHTLTLG